jgi:1-acyl-sn-glycerol-3-phosphate acyltransferase
VPSSDSTDLDKPWSRSLAACVGRNLLICGVFGSIIDTYARVEVVDGQRLELLDGPAIFVANHCSHVDTPLLLRSLPARLRHRTAVAAAVDYFYRKPLLAAAVSLAFGTVPLERRSARGGIDAAGHIERLIDNGWNVVVFAEGTRSRDGRVGVLRSGAAVLAARHGVPIVPVHISGTHRAMPPGRGWMERPEAGGRRARHDIRVSFGVPIAVAPDDEPLETMEDVRLFMVASGAETTPDPRLTDRRAIATEDVAEIASAAHGQAV